MDNQIKIWSLVTYECIIAFKCHSDSILCLELTLDGNLVSCLIVVNLIIMFVVLKY